jgi:hypothetical protein
VAELVERRASPSEAFADEPLPTWASRMKLEGWYRNDESVGQIALEIANALEPDVMLVIFKSVDPASHVLYATHFADDELPRPLPATDSQRASGRRVLQRFYEHADAWLGRLLTHYTQDDLVLVVSDHGFQVRKQFTGLTGEHHRGEALAGILFARGAGIEAGGRVENVHVRDMTPSVLHWLGLPVAEDMDGRPAAFIGGGEPTRIASYDRGPIERVGAKGSGAEAVMLEELEALGYFEPEEAAGSAPARAPEAHP